MGGYALNKIRSIFFPQIVLIIHRYLFNGITGKASWDIDVISILSRGWFLWILLYISLIWWSVYRICKKNRFIWIVVAALDVLLVLLINNYGLKSGINIEILPMAFLFYLAGFFIKKVVIAYDINIKIILQKVKWLFVVFALVTFVVSQINVPIAMYLNTYGNLILFFSESMSGIAMTICFSAYFERIGFIQWIGANTITFYVFNFCAVDSFRGLRKLLIQKSSILADANIYTLYFCEFLCIMLALTLTTIFCNKYLWFLFGKKKPQR